MSLKKIVDSLTDKLKISSTAVRDIIKANSQYVSAENKAAEMSKKRILALKNYIIAEDPNLNVAIDNVVKRIESIENHREEKTKQIEEKIINFLKKIIEEEKAMVDKLKKASSAEKNLIKARNKVSKLQSKPVEKQKPEQLNEARMSLRELEASYNQIENEAKTEENIFQKKKSEIIQLILKYIVNIEKSYYENAYREIGI